MRGFDRRRWIRLILGSKWFSNVRIYVLRLVIGSISDHWSGSKRTVNSNPIWLWEATEVSIDFRLGSMVLRLVFVPERESESYGCVLVFVSDGLQVLFFMESVRISFSELENKDLLDLESGLIVWVDLGKQGHSLFVFLGALQTFRLQVNEVYTSTELIEDLIRLLVGGGGLLSQNVEVSDGIKEKIIGSLSFFARKLLISLKISGRFITWEIIIYQVMNYH